MEQAKRNLRQTKTTKAAKAANHEAAKSQWKEERISENRGNENKVSMKREC